MSWRASRPASAADPTAIKVVLKADSGSPLSRCHSCIKGGAYPDNASVYIEPGSELTSVLYAQFYLQKLANGKYALQAVESGNYLARCNNCVPGAPYPDSAFVHVTPAQLSSTTWAQFTLVRLSNGKYTLQADSGNYLASCNNCTPTGIPPPHDNAFVHVTPAQLSGATWAQWEIIVIP